jgi:serine/threonine protein kinase
MDDDFRGHRLTEVGFVCGTPQYLSPEQVEGERGDARSDLYSAGVVMYALLAGRLPFDGPDPIEVARRQIREPVPPLSDALPAAVVQFVMKLLAKNPWDRFGSASEAIRMLKELPQNPT